MDIGSTTFSPPSAVWKMLPSFGDLVQLPLDHWLFKEKNFRVSHYEVGLGFIKIILM